MVVGWVGVMPPPLSPLKGTIVKMNYWMKQIFINFIGYLTILFSVSVILKILFRQLKYEYDEKPDLTNICMQMIER